MYLIIKNLLEELDVAVIPLSRKRELDQLSNYINDSLQERDAAQLTFICTHNSRRSHLCQIWAQIAANYYGIDHISCYSGGTEVTAVYPQIINTLEDAGLRIDQNLPLENPNYELAYSDTAPAIPAFSKQFDHEVNPVREFAAIMTCDHASENCPIVPGAEKRISITYLDPKVSDGTPEQKAIYKERSLQIATEMKYVFSNVKPQ
ncbi:MAG: protein-tyrosine-phosphatase [Nonlabens sp.]|uniref:protein-tyrosine-phosphatase n=1 Tax=Nonlabens sp. TaxID=1888209 RepID=UPI003EF52CD9